MTIDPLIAGIPIIGGGAMLGFSGLRRRWRKERAKEAAARRRIEEEQTALRPDVDVRFRAPGHGQIPLAVFGSYGSSLLPALLEAFAMAGAEDFVGPILLCELARDLREICLREMPQQFRGRVIEVKAEMLIGGLGGDSIAEVQEQEKFWFTEVKQYTGTWLEAIDRQRAVTRVSPMMLFTQLSSAGHSALAYYPLREFHDRFPTAPIYASTILDSRTAIRSRFSDVAALFDADQLIRGYITTDNRLDEARNDFGMAQLLSSMTVGSWLTTRHVGPLNGLNGIFPKKEPGKTATISVWAETIPVFSLPGTKKLPALYYTSPGVVQEKIIRGIERIVRDASLQGLPLAAAGAGSARILDVIAPIAPEPFRRDIAQIEERIGPWLKEHDIDLTVQYVSAGQRLTPESTTALISLVLLQGLSGGKQELRDLADGLRPIDQIYLARRNGAAPHHQDQALLTSDTSNGAKR